MAVLVGLTVQVSRRSSVEPLEAIEKADGEPATLRQDVRELVVPAIVAGCAREVEGG